MHADALSSTVYRVRCKGSTHILKLFYNTMRYRKEKYYLTALQGVIPVAKILHSIAPEGGFHGAVILEEIPGDLLQAETLSADAAFQMGAILARLHSLPVESYGDLSLPPERRVKKAPVELMRNYFEASLAECTHIAQPKLLEQCARYVEEHLAVFLNAQGPCIVHRDYRPGNVIAHEGRVRAIIDFENALGSFPEEDFGQMEMLAWHSHPHSRTPFYAGYASVRPLPENLDEILPVMHFLKSLGALGFTWERGTWQTHHASIYKKNLIFIEKFLANH